MLLPLLPGLVAAVAAAADIDGVDAADDLWLESGQASFIDIRLGIGVMTIPDTYDVDVAIAPDFGGGSVNYTDQLDGDQATTYSYGMIGGRLDPFGVLTGFEIVYGYSHLQLEGRTQDGDPVAVPAGTSSIMYRSLGGNLLLGTGWALGSGFHVETLGVLGLGAVTLGFADQPAANEMEGSGWYWNAGVRAGLYYNWGRLVIGALAEYTYMDLQAETNWLDANTSTQSDTTGVGWRIELGYHIPR